MSTDRQVAMERMRSLHRDLMAQDPDTISDLLNKGWRKSKRTDCTDFYKVKCEDANYIWFWHLATQSHYGKSYWAYQVRQGKMKHTEVLWYYVTKHDKHKKDTYGNLLRVGRQWIMRSNYVTDGTINVEWMKGGE